MTDVADSNESCANEGAHGDRRGSENPELPTLAKNEGPGSGVDLSADLSRNDGQAKEEEKTREGEGTDSGFGSSGSSQQSITLPENQVGVFLCPLRPVKN